MLENFNEDKRKNSMAQFSDFHTGWSIICKFFAIFTKYNCFYTPSSYEIEDILHPV